MILSVTEEASLTQKEIDTLIYLLENIDLKEESITVGADTNYGTIDFTFINKNSDLKKATESWSKAN